MTAFLDAAIASLIERGYAGTTTAEISRRAGASPGLFVRYWSTKADLLVAAAGYAQRRSLARFEERWQSASSGAGDDRARIRAALGTIIELFDEPEMRCLAELEAAARTDSELASALAATTASIDDLVLRAARRLAPGRRGGKVFDQRVRLVLDCARGLALRTSAASPQEAAAARAETTAALAGLFDLAPTNSTH